MLSEVCQADFHNSKEWIGSAHLKTSYFNYAHPQFCKIYVILDSPFHNDHSQENMTIRMQSR